MNKAIRLFAACFLLSSFSNLVAQEYYEDGSMKISEISTDSKYGFEGVNKHSIKVGKIENQRPYLAALRGPNGEEIQYRRTGSCCAFKSKSAAFGQGLLDRYELTYAGLGKSIFIYLNGYEYENPKAPMGLKFITPDQVQKPYVFPADSIVRVEFCDKNKVFAVKNFLLNEQGIELNVPEIPASFEGGEADLKLFFASRPLDDEKAKGIAFRVAVAFVVNCEGKTGNYQIITKGKGKAETFANQVLERVNSMPQKWKPASSGGAKVDSYQVLTFTIADGIFSQVSYQ